MGHTVIFALITMGRQIECCRYAKYTGLKAMHFLYYYLLSYLLVVNSYAYGVQNTNIEAMYTMVSTH